MGAAYSASGLTANPLGPKPVEVGNVFHCAEAVAWAVLKALQENPEQAAAHATAFGGGFGRSFEEACGALSGGLIAIGHLHGRSAPEGEWDIPAKLGAELRHRFVEDFGTTHCATLRERFGRERQMQECRRLVQQVVVRLLELLEENRVQAAQTIATEIEKASPDQEIIENAAGAAGVQQYQADLGQDDLFVDIYFSIATKFADQQLWQIAMEYYYRVFKKNSENPKLSAKIAEWIPLQYQREKGFQISGRQPNQTAAGS